VATTSKGPLLDRSSKVAQWLSDACRPQEVFVYKLVAHGMHLANYDSHDDCSFNSYVYWNMHSLTAVLKLVDEVPTTHFDA
jgi:hypothetical protein